MKKDSEKDGGNFKWLGGCLILLAFPIVVLLFELFPVGLLATTAAVIVSVFAYRKISREIEEQARLTECPFCREKIAKGAVKCKYCLSELPPGVPES